MYERVVIAVDGGPGGCDACALGTQLASATATLTVTYVAVIAAITPNTAVERADPEHLPGVLCRERELCEGRAACVRVAANTVAEGIADQARQIDADLIVLGRRRHHGLAVLVARDARSVLRHSNCAVAVAPHHYADHRRPIRRIGVAVDERPPSKVALAHAGRLSADLHAELRPLTVTAGDRSSAVRELRRFAGDVDLLVCGSRRPGAVARVLSDSVSERLLGRVAAPLLIAPPSDPEALRRWAAGTEAVG
jgi:nucleotide-binding universal stress UspA family protein